MADDINSPDRLGSYELESLMHRYQQSDRVAEASLAEQLSPRLNQYFFAKTRNRDQAQDLLQECWLRIHKARHTYRPGQPLLPWIYAIAHHVRVDQYRKERRTAHVQLQPDDKILATESAPHPAKTSALELWDLLKLLPQQQREAVLLLKVAGLSVQEASRAAGVSIGAVKQRAHRAYTTLRRLIGENR